MTLSHKEYVCRRQEKGHGEQDSKTQQKRLITRVPRLDFITKGGLFQGASYAIMGPPGSGKTVLANQIAFNHVKDGGRALYVTLLTESHARMLANLEEMTFFDRSVIPDKLHYVSGYPELEKEGLKALLDMVRRTAQRTQATLLIIDGMDAAKEFARSDLSFKRFLQDLQAFTSILGCTTLLLAPHQEGDTHPENTAVDGIFELSLWLSGPRAVRELVALKFRGSDSLLRPARGGDLRARNRHPPSHRRCSSPTPRREAARTASACPSASLAWMSRSEAVLLSGSTTMLLGAPGTGKTLLGLHFLLQGAREGQPGVYFGFYETPPRLLEKAAGRGNEDLKKYVDNGLIEIQLAAPAGEQHGLAGRAAPGAPPGAQREAHRASSSMACPASAPPPCTRIAWGASSPRSPPTADAGRHHALLRGAPLLQPRASSAHAGRVRRLRGRDIILLRYVELRSQLYRLISLMKMRESQYDSGIREFSITDEGIQVSDTFESAENILTGHARVRNGGKDTKGKEVSPPMGGPEKKKKKGKRGGFLRRRRS